MAGKCETTEDSVCTRSRYRRKKKDLTKIKTLYTHGGYFHADDVLSTALLRILGVSAPLIRVSNISELPPDREDVLIYDIGFGAYDHHQLHKLLRANYVPYASFGLLWLDYGALLVGEKAVALIDRYFIEPIDYSDNCLMPNAFSMLIMSYNYSYGFDAAVEYCINLLNMIFSNITLNSDIFDEKFLQKSGTVYVKKFKALYLANAAVNFNFNSERLRTERLSISELWYEVTSDIYPRDFADYFNNKYVSVIAQALKSNTSLRFVLHMYMKFCGDSAVDAFLMQLLDYLNSQINEEYNFISSLHIKYDYSMSVAYIDRYYPYRPGFADSSVFSKVDYVVMPSVRNLCNYEIYAVSKNSYDFEPKRVFPEFWRGKTEEELVSVCPGLTFCHLQGFLCVVRRSSLPVFLNILKNSY